MLCAATAPLLELFATVDDVFTEDDALGDVKRKMTLGRIYREWKSVRAQLDSDFVARKEGGLPIRRMGDRLRESGRI